jgi:deferrochelatase/peroxidase EfeB
MNYNQLQEFLNNSNKASVVLGLDIAKTICQKYFLTAFDVGPDATNTVAAITKDIADTMQKIANDDYDIYEKVKNDN